MADDEVPRNLSSMDDLDFRAWNGADWHGLFARYHTDDVFVDVHGQPPTHGIEWTVPASVDTRFSCPIRRESEKWVRHAAHIRR